MEVRKMSEKKKEFYQAMAEAITKLVGKEFKKEEKSIYIGWYSKTGEKLIAVNKSKKFRLFFNNIGQGSMEKFNSVDGFRPVSKEERKANKYGSTDYIYEGVSEVRIEEMAKLILDLKGTKK